MPSVQDRQLHMCEALARPAAVIKPSFVLRVSQRVSWSRYLTTINQTFFSGSEAAALHSPNLRPSDRFLFSLINL